MKLARYQRCILDGSGLRIGDQVKLDTVLGVECLLDTQVAIASRIGQDLNRNRRRALKVSIRLLATNDHHIGTDHRVVADAALLVVSVDKQRPDAGRWFGAPRGCGS